MRFSELGEALRAHGIAAEPYPSGSVADPCLKRACSDSRRVRSGDLFCALVGTRNRGLDFAEQARRRGAVAFLGQEPVEDSLTWVLRDGQQSASAMGWAAAALQAYPSRSLWTAAVTGTNGKSSVVHLFARAMASVERPTEMAGTLGLRLEGRHQASLSTTPSADILQQWLAEAREAGAQAAILEASSHGIEQQRIAGLEFRAAAWTNLSQDHLDYHQDMEQYARAKARLFWELDAQATALLPSDGIPSRLCDRLQADRLTWSLGASADLRAVHHPDSIHQHLVVASPWGEGEIRSRLIGAHNAENLLVAAGLMALAGVPMEQACTALSAVEAPAGRLERVDSPQGFHLYVDYAHTPDALEKALHALRRRFPAAALRVLFGAGGDRDATKRAQMGEAAARHSDYCHVTSDNPRSEDPASIAEQVMEGVQRVGTPADMVVDRREAIRSALGQMAQGDVLLVAGKGHEDYQEIQGRREPFDDRIELKEAGACLA